MNNWTELPQGESTILNRIVWQILFIAAIGILIGVIKISYQSTDYMVTGEAFLLMLLTTHFIRKKLLFNHGFEKIKFDHTTITHRIYRWIFFSTTTLKRVDIEQIQLVNIRKRETDSIPSYFSDYRVEVSLTKNRKHFIGNFLSKEEGEALVKKLK